MLLQRRKVIVTQPEATKAPEAKTAVSAIKRRVTLGTLPPQAPLQPHLLTRRDTTAGSASDNHARTEKAKLEIERQLKLISESFEAIDKAQEIADRATKIIEAQLKLVNLKRHDDGVYAAELKEVYSRQSRTIDPKKFRAHVDAEVFWASIKVSVEQAKGSLTEKELNAMSDVVPSKMTGIVISIAKVDAKKAPKKP